MGEAAWDRAVQRATAEARCDVCHGTMRIQGNRPYRYLSWRCTPCQRVTRVWDIPGFLRAHNA